MFNLKDKRSVLCAAIGLLSLVLTLPSVAVAKPHGKGRGSDKKKEKFVNGHDARDGRWDGRGPKGKHRHDRDDDDRNDDRDDDRYRHDRRIPTHREYDRNHNGIDDRTEIHQQALRIGYREGHRAGSQDRYGRRGPRCDDHRTFRDGTAGYRDHYGYRDLYREGFREGFRQGYEDGHHSRNPRHYGPDRDTYRDIFGR